MGFVNMILQEEWSLVGARGCKSDLTRGVVLGRGRGV